MEFEYLGDEQEKPNQIELIGKVSPAVAPEVAESKAAKYDFVLGERSPGADTIKAGITTGEDEVYKDLVRQQKSLEFLEHKRAMVEDLVASQQGPVSQAEMDFIMGLSEADMAEIGSSEFPLETEYGKKFIRTAVEQDERRTFFDAQMWDPEKTNLIMDGFEDLASKAQIIESLYVENEQRWEDQGLFNKGLDYLENFLDPSAPFNTNNAVANAPTESVFMSGSNLQEQVDYLMGLPPEQFGTELRAAVESLAENNPLDARRLLDAVKQYSDSDAALDNVFGLLGVGEILGAAFKVGKASKTMKLGVPDKPEGTRPAIPESLEPAVNGMKSALRESARAGTPDVSRTAKAMGAFRTSAVHNVVRKFSDLGRSMQRIAGGSEVIKKIPSAMNPGSFFDKRLGARSDEVLEKLVTGAEEADSLVTRMLTKVDAAGTPMQRLAVLADRMWKSNIEGKMDGLQNQILDVDVGRANRYEIINEPISNTDRISVALGRQDTTLFDTRGEAANEAFFLKNSGKIDQYNIMPHGTGFYIEAQYIIPDNPTNIAGIKLPDTAKFNTGLLRNVFGWIGSTKLTLSADNSLARLVSTHSPSKFVKMYEELAQPIKDLSKKELLQMEEVWKFNRDFVDDAGVRGMWFESAYELERHFIDKFGELPTDAQLDAYRAYRQLNDLDFVVRSASWYKDKIRAGIDNWSFQYEAPEADGFKMTTRTFEGRELKDPSTLQVTAEDPIRVLHIDPMGIPKVLDSRNVDDLVIIDELKNRALEKQTRIIQVADGNLKMKSLTSDGSPVGIGFVFTSNASKRPITMVDKYRAGGHVVQRYSHYIKQGRLENDMYGDNYTGDVAIAGAPTRAEAAKRAKFFDEARLMLARGVDNKTLGDFTSKHLRLSANEFTKMFEDLVDPNTGEVIRKGLRKDVPIVATNSGQKTSDVMKYDPKVKDLTNSKYNLLSEMNRKFAGERNDQNLWVYDEENDLLVLDKDGQLFDPTETLRQAAKNVVDLRFKKEYTLQSADAWVNQFGHLLEGDTILREPIKTLYNPTFKMNASAEELKAAKAAQRQILSFLGHKNDEESMFEIMKHKLRDAAYEKKGQKGLEVVDNWVIPLVDDPLTVMRTIAFHSKLGLFNWQQYAVQAQGLVSLSALSKQSAAAIAVYPMMRHAMVAPKHLKTWASHAAKFGWKEDEFLDMFGALENSGWATVKGTAGFLDDLSNPRIFQSKFGKAMDAGAVFFEEGEKVVRMASYAAAYREWKLANKGKALTREARASILSRADDLSINMSAANNSMWQKGILGVPLQFYSYQARLTELYLSKRLPAKDRAKLFAIQAAFYGVPTAAGGAIGVWPAYESVREMLLENNINYNEDVLTQFVTQGGIATLMSQMGFEADFASRFGSGGIPVIKEWLDGSRELHEIIIGASGTIIGDMAVAFGSTIGGVAAVVRGDKSFYDFSTEDVLSALRNVSTVNNTARAFIALNTEKWVSKHGTELDKVTAAEVIYMTATGDQMDRLEDMYAKENVMTNRDEMVRSVSKDIGDMFVRGAQETDPAIRKEYMKKSWGMAQAAGLTPEEHSRAIQNAFNRLSDTKLETVEKNFSEDIINRPRIQ